MSSTASSSPAPSAAPVRPRVDRTDRQPSSHASQKHTGRSRGWSGVGLPLSPRPSDSIPFPTSPPLSARSFGTFIDSEPSTPSFSPPLESSWDRSALVILHPVDTDDGATSSPTEPVWEMMVPPRRAIKQDDAQYQGQSTKPANPMFPPAAGRLITPYVEWRSSEDETTTKDDADDAVDDDDHGYLNAPLEKLTTRMRGFLRKVAEPDKKKRNGRRDFEKIESVHWTEM